ncbi:MAG: hypothetical protein ACE5G8_04150 [Anaerolineae bacterium]
MAVAKKKRRRGFQGRGGGKKATPQKSRANRIWLVVAGVAVLGLMALGMAEVFQGNRAANAPRQGVQIQAEGLEAVSLDEAAKESAPAIDSAPPPTDRETAYLGSPTDAEGLVRAETGRAGMPTLVWFHADW